MYTTYNDDHDTDGDGDGDDDTALFVLHTILFVSTMQFVLSLH